MAESNCLNQNNWWEWENNEFGGIEFLPPLSITHSTSKRIYLNTLQGDFFVLPDDSRLQGPLPLKHRYFTSVAILETATI
jgi:hypothetical protein